MDYSLELYWKFIEKEEEEASWKDSDEFLIRINWKFIEKEEEASWEDLNGILIGIIL